MPTNVQVPGLGESVSEATLIKWHKNDGDLVKTDEPICELETEKANVDIPSPGAGVLKRAVNEGTKVRIGQTIATIDADAKASAKPAVKQSQASAGGETAAPAKAATATATAAKNDEKKNDEKLSPAVRRMVTENQLDSSRIPPTGPGGRITKEDVIKHLEKGEAPANNYSTSRATDADFAAATSVMEQSAPASRDSAAGTRRIAMSPIRRKIAQRLVSAQQTAAILTTFNEIDLHAIMDLRSKFKERFEKVHGVGLGFMSFFARAVVLALKQFERVNGQIEGDDVVLHDYVHLGIAVNTDRGLAVPVLRHVDKMSFAKIESEIKRLAAATREGKLSLQELSGGTFTITNGGVFGSLLSTPIINPPQSAILGMHTIKERPIAVNGQVVIRPMMYVALSYDHRLIDGVESVSFLVRLKEFLEDPARLMLEI